MYSVRVTKLLFALEDTMPLLSIASIQRHSVTNSPLSVWCSDVLPNNKAPKGIITNGHTNACYELLKNRGLSNNGNIHLFRTT